MMHFYDIALAVIIILTGASFVLALKQGVRMDKLMEAIARLEASVNKSNAKIDALVAIQTPVNLDEVTAKINSYADALEAKNG